MQWELWFLSLCFLVSLSVTPYRFHPLGWHPWLNEEGNGEAIWAPSFFFTDCIWMWAAITHSCQHDLVTLRQNKPSLSCLHQAFAHSAEIVIMEAYSKSLSKFMKALKWLNNGNDYIWEAFWFNSLMQSYSKRKFRVHIKINLIHNYIFLITKKDLLVR